MVLMIKVTISVVFNSIKSLGLIISVLWLYPNYIFINVSLIMK